MSDELILLENAARDALTELPPAAAASFRTIAVLRQLGTGLGWATGFFGSVAVAVAMVNATPHNIDGAAPVFFGVFAVFSVLYYFCTRFVRRVFAKATLRALERSRAVTSLGGSSSVAVASMLTPAQVVVQAAEKKKRPAYVRPLRSSADHEAQDFDDAG